MRYTITPNDSLNDAVNRLVPGDVLRLEPGTYHEVVTCSLLGTVEQPITIEGADPDNRPVIDGFAPHDLEEAEAAGVDINYGLPQAKISKRNGNTWSKTYGATAASKALFNCEQKSGNYIIRNMILQNSLGRIWNHEAAAGDSSRNITFENVDMHWSRLQILSIKNVANVTFRYCNFSHAASFFQTAYRPATGPDGDKQTHNAAISLGNVDGVIMQDCELHDCWGEGIITNANEGESKKITIIGFSAWDCYKTPLYIHASSDVNAGDVLVYRSAENLKYGHSDSTQVDGKDNPVLKTPAINIQSSEGDKDWDTSTHDVSVDGLIASYTHSGLSLSGSAGTAPISNISFDGCTIIEPVGYGLILKGNKPRFVTVKNNTFYSADPGKQLGYAIDNRYDNTSDVDYNNWTTEPDNQFLVGEHDKYWFDLDIKAEPLPAGTTIDDLLKPPELPVEITESFHVQGAYWVVTVSENQVTAVRN